MLFHVPCLGPRGSRSSSLLLSSLPSWLHPVRDLWALALFSCRSFALGRLASRVWCASLFLGRALSVHQAPRAPQSRLVPVILMLAVPTGSNSNRPSDVPLAIQRPYTTTHQSPYTRIHTRGRRRTRAFRHPRHGAHMSLDFCSQTVVCSSSPAWSIAASNSTSLPTQSSLCRYPFRKHRHRHFAVISTCATIEPRNRCLYIPPSRS